LTIEAAHAKNPSERIMAREIRVRRFTCRFQTMGIGRLAKTTSVKMLMAVVFSCELLLF